MRITKDTGTYNARRYGQPWIAHVVYTPAGKSQYVWGAWNGIHGQAGILVIDVAAGDIVAIGQRDYRGGHSNNTWYLVGDDGSLTAITQADAYRHWATAHAA